MQRTHVQEPGYSIARARSRYSSRQLDMGGPKISVQDANQIDDRIHACEYAVELGVIVYIGLHDVSSRKHEERFGAFPMPRGYAQVNFPGSEQIGEMSSHEAAAAKNADVTNSHGPTSSFAIFSLL
jgi:hypothetical protein